jgi:Domain of unknown function (DUF4431)
MAAWRILTVGLTLTLFGFGMANSSLSTPLAKKVLYEPHVTQLTGTLVKEVAPGAPNYSSIEDGDKAETYWFLKLQTPVDIDADKAVPVNEQERNISKIQLVLDHVQYKKWKSQLKKRVTVTGTLFHRWNAHHHAPVLMIVQNVRAIVK